MIERSLLLAFAQRFIGRRDDYALQQHSGRYRRVGAPLSTAVLHRHLAGQETIGTYVIDERGRCRFAVYDADMPDGLSLLAGVQAKLADVGIGSFLECSRRGGHLWVLFAPPLTPASVRRWLLPYGPPGVEFYPKQETLGQGYGSLIRVPLGVHQRSGRRYPFVQWQAGTPVLVAPSTSAQLSWCCTLVQTAAPDDLALLSSPSAMGATPPHTSITKNVSTAAMSGYASIAAWCAAQDPFSLIGRYVRLDQRGMGHCPFGEHHRDGVDQHPSFRVYVPSVPGGCCWYCYTWGHGGNVFNFLARYHRLDAKTLWSRILAGASF
ncbi:MAG TPA: CHC2 zinc finger domain-containing protein [Ktedonobacteraceae bacterium]|nr:CHC2 zinc finger domain-containing protein [Ktedonobacteraceae bacterium]